MLITITGPLPSGFNFFNYAFNVGGGDGDNIFFPSTGSDATIGNLFTNSTTTFIGRNVNLNDRSDPPRLDGTITGWETRDGNGTLVTTVTGINWSGNELFNALIDLWDFNNSTDIVSLFSLQDMTVDATGAGQDLSELDLSWIDSNLTYLGSSFSDHAVGGVGDDLLRGGRDNDTLNGSAGNDRLFGDAGRDILRGDDGNDTLNGGGGGDRLFGDAGQDIVRGGGGNDTLIGGGGDDALVGNGGRDIVRGGSGNDTLNGGNGNDRLFGQVGNDTLIGGRGNDTLNGGGGDDKIVGGRGNDLAIGGRGSDTFVFGDGDDNLIIRDFRFGQNDRLELDEALWDGTLSTSDVVSTYGSVVDGDFVLDFGDGDVLVLEGVTNAAQIVDHIDIL